MSKIVPGSVRIHRHHDSVSLYFRVNASNGECIRFPVQFTDDRVFVNVLSYYNGENFVQCGQTRQGITDRRGFRLSKLVIPTSDSSPYWDESSDYVEVEVIGKDIVQE